VLRVERYAHHHAATGRAAPRSFVVMVVNAENGAQNGSGLRHALSPD
jgi:hypothetical protein